MTGDDKSTGGMAEQDVGVDAGAAQIAEGRVDQGAGEDQPEEPFKEVVAKAVKMDR